MEMDESTILLQSPNYNSFFHPNVCHVCKGLNNLMECPSCHMIYYCSEEHMMLHREKHEEICEAIKNLNAQKNIWNNDPMTKEEWDTFKKDNMQSIQSMLNRDLQPYEKQMFLRAKCCFICHVQNKLYDSCFKCLLISTCFEHEAKINDHVCTDLENYLELNKHNMYRVDRNKGISKRYLISYNKKTCDMESFIQSCMRRNRHRIDWSLNDYINSDDFSEPLTLLHVLRQQKLLLSLQTTDTIVVHIITGRKMDIRRLSAWEFFLHEFSSRKMLIIVMIQPELENRYYSFETCIACRYKSRKLEYKSHCMLYHHYASSKSYLKPNVIVAYDVEFRYEKSWAEIIKECQRQQCPLLLTTKSKIIANDNIMIIKESLNLPVNYILYEKNKFASLMPDRDDENQSACYSNQYLTYYLNLEA